MKGETGIKKLLFIQSFRYGDMLYLLALIHTVRKYHPEYEIAVLHDRSTGGLPFLEPLRVKDYAADFPWSRAGWYRDPAGTAAGVFRAARRFRGEFAEYTAFDPRGDIRHKLVLTLLRPREIVSYASDGPALDRIRGIYDRHIFLRHAEFLRENASRLELPADVEISWPWIEPGGSGGCGGKRKEVVAFVPGASNELRRWPAENWSALSGKLTGDGWKTLLIRYAGDAALSGRETDFGGTWSGSIGELVGVLGSCAAVVAVDSFVGHLAAAAGVPVVSLFGPQDPELWYPWGPGTKVVVADGFPCRPCPQKRCVVPEATCMDAIGVDTVYAAFREIH